ncbi:hypothetical protein BCR34DRAFT_197 [Clohesyomyces aquaticus]|uniref:Uncharacterized protein n=1 Tax=Clohesyomyces aquaticus TaxID=1231657 RepID=A0A1Y2AAW7_9PLEO|nr:hypothetical protein BCR34DRAFT_197 [Clohesyomyces aquaticus]
MMVFAADMLGSLDCRDKVKSWQFVRQPARQRQNKRFEVNNEPWNAGTTHSTNRENLKEGSRRSIISRYPRKIAKWGIRDEKAAESLCGLFLASLRHSSPHDPARPLKNSFRLRHSMRIFSCWMECQRTPRYPSSATGFGMMLMPADADADAFRMS